MSTRTRTLIWTLAVLSAGTAAMFTAVGTAPPETNGDMWDSPIFIPSILAASLLAATPTFITKSNWPLYALAAIAPYYAMQLINGILITKEPLATAGLFLLIPITLIPLACTFTAQAIAKIKTSPTSKKPGPKPGHQKDL